MRMTESEHRYGISVSQAITICVACATLILGLLAMLPET
jgi:hypothetical protein